MREVLKVKRCLQIYIQNVSMDVCVHMFEGIMLRGMRIKGVFCVYNSKSDKCIPKCYVK